MRRSAIWPLFFAILAPLLPGAWFNAAYAQTGEDLGVSVHVIGSWLASMVTTLGTPAAVVGSVVGGLYWATRLLVRVVINGKPIDLNLQIDDRILSVKLFKKPEA